MPVPAMPRARLVVGETQLRLGGLECILNRPSLPLHPHQLSDWGPGRTPGREERQILIDKAAPDQQAAGPQAGEIIVVFLRPEIRQLDISPVIQAQALGAVSRRQASPNLRGKSLRDLLGRA